MNKQKRSEFDEREVALRGRAFLHGFAILAALLFADFVLSAVGISWAAGRAGGLILLATANLAVHLECIFRNVSHGHGRSPRRNLTLPLAAAAFVVFLNIFLYVRQDSPALAVEGQLTLWGSVAIAQWVLILTKLCDIAKLLYDMKQPRKEGDA